MKRDNDGKKRQTLTQTTNIVAAVAPSAKHGEAAIKLGTGHIGCGVERMCCGFDCKWGLLGHIRDALDMLRTDIGFHV